MASFVMKQMVGNKFNEVTGGLNKLSGDDEAAAAKTEGGEDPEIIVARQEQEERRKEKHRKMEAEREKMRGDIRNKYNIHKKDEEGAFGAFGAGRDDGHFGSARKKTPEELAQEKNAADEDSLINQLGLQEQVAKAKTAVNSAFETVRGFLPFGK